MTVTNWNTTTINGVEYLVIEVAQFRVPLDWDPSSNMFIAVAAPNGGVGNFPALVKGDDGTTPTIDSAINLTALDYDDPTPDSADFEVLSPNLYQLNLSLHKGEPGAAGANNIIDATDLTGTPVAGKIIVVNTNGDGFEYASQKVGDRFIAAAINSTPSGNTAYTLATVSVPAQGFDWRPDVSGQCVIVGTGADVRVDLVARLNNETAGNIIGRAFGAAGQNPPTHVLVSGPPAASADTYDKVSAGSAATIYLRAERQTGTETFTTTSATTSFAVRVRPVP